MELDKAGTILLYNYRRIEKLKASAIEEYEIEAKMWRDEYLAYIAVDPYISQTLTDLLYKDKHD